jgi:S-adenosyl-L-methionine hydrolase (adenosine-forming)
LYAYQGACREQKMSKLSTRPLIVLLTDFGQTDGYVGIIKAVMHSINPEISFIDLAHEITPGDIAGAAFILARSFPYFPNQTIFVVIVDPGVGSSRRILAVKTKFHYFLAPDNGVLQYVFASEPEPEVVQVMEQRYFLPQISQTFHGRDIFAPVAAHLSKGLELMALGPYAMDYNKGNIPPSVFADGYCHGQIIYVDRFGNCTSNIEAARLKEGPFAYLQVGRNKIEKLLQFYGEGERASLLCLVGSHGFIEIALREGNAAQEYGIKVMDKVKLAFRH